MTIIRFLQYAVLLIQVDLTHCMSVPMELSYTIPTIYLPSLSPKSLSPDSRSCLGSDIVCVDLMIRSLQVLLGALAFHKSATRNSPSKRRMWTT